MEFVLSMTFLTEYGEKSNLSISGVKSTMTQAQANGLMDIIIAKNVLITATGALVGKGGAHLTERKITKYEVA